jgi:protein-tyrosine phosphatase
MRNLEGCSLWLGNVGDVANPQDIVAAGILAVVDVALNEKPAALPRDLSYCRFPLIDGTGNPPWLLRLSIETVASLLRSGTPTLVYCSAGLSRSPSIAGAALALVRGCPFDEGLKIVTQAAHADVSPALWSEIRELFTPCGL